VDAHARRSDLPPAPPLGPPPRAPARARPTHSPPPPRRRVPALTPSAQVAAGCFIRAVNGALPPGSQLLGARVLVGAVLAMSVAMFASKAFIDARILEPRRRQEAAALAAAEGAGADGAAAAAKKPAGKKKKEKGSFSENFAVLRSSAKIRNLALLVMGYGVAHRCAPSPRTAGSPPALPRRHSQCSGRPGSSGAPREAGAAAAKGLPFLCPSRQGPARPRPRPRPRRAAPPRRQAV
jgi:hypothetical protein